MAAAPFSALMGKHGMTSGSFAAAAAAQPAASWFRDCRCCSISAEAAAARRRPATWLAPPAGTAPLQQNIKLAASRLASLHVDAVCFDPSNLARSAFCKLLVSAGKKLSRCCVPATAEKQAPVEGGHLCRTGRQSCGPRRLRQKLARPAGLSLQPYDVTVSDGVPGFNAVQSPL